MQVLGEPYHRDSFRRVSLNPETKFFCAIHHLFHQCSGEFYDIFKSRYSSRSFITGQIVLYPRRAMFDPMLVA